MSKKETPTPITTRYTPVWTMGERLRKARTDANLEQIDLANILNVSRPLISRFEHDKSTIDVEQLPVWAKTCQVPVSWLMGIGDDLVEAPDGTVMVRNVRYTPRDLKLPKPSPNAQSVTVQAGTRGQVRVLRPASQKMTIAGPPRA